MNDEARELITELGSIAAKLLGYRDNWIFVGGKGIGGLVQSRFEKVPTNTPQTLS